MNKFVSVLLCSVALASCGQRIKFDEAAVEVIEVGSNAGVQEQEISTGRFWAPPFSYRYIVKFPTTLQTYKWTGDACIPFINADRVQTFSCFSANIRINPGDADNIVRKYKGAITRGGDGYVLDDVVNGPITRELRQAVIQNGGKYSSAQLYADGGRALLDDVTKAVAPKFTNDGIVIQDLLSDSPPILPKDIVDSIKGALKAQTEAARKDAELAATIAEGKKTVAQAQANAEARRLTGESLRANPEVLKLEEISRRGASICPTGVNVCVVGGDASALVATQ